MDRKYTNRRYLDALQEHVLIFDGAMGTSLQQQKLTAAEFGGEQYNGCNDYLVISYPQAVEKVHRSFLESGVDVLETDTFRSNRLTLGEYGLGERTLEINRAAAALARRLADEYSSPAQPRFVAGSIGPSGKLPSADDPELSNIGFDELADIFREQAVGLIQGGADLLLIETSQDILEVKAAIRGLERAFEETGVYLPVQAQVTLDTTGRMLLGTDIAAALAILEGMAIDVIGLNCSTGPEHMRQPIAYLGEHARLPISCIPNAGLPLNVDGEAVYPLEPEPFTAALVEFVEKNHISVVGGCCGTTPQHLKVLVDKLGGRPHPSRPTSDDPRPATLRGTSPATLRGASLASMMRAMPMQQQPPPLLIGERCNAQGSRKFKRLLLAEDYDAILELAREHNAAVLVLTIDEKGMARTAAHKLEVAQRIYDIAVGEHSLRPEALVFDTLTFTLATGDPEFAESAIETLEGIRQIKAALPGVLTSLGVSNVSFGLDAAARPVLNSIMLYHAVQAGLDMAIVNPAHITPYAEIPVEERELAEDLIFNRRPDALQRFIEYYASATTGAQKQAAGDPTTGLTAEQRLAWRILHRHKDGVEADIDEIIGRDPDASRHETAVNILNNVLLPAMKEVGDRFGAGELILPFVLQSAEVMKKAVSHVEQYLERSEGTTKGTVVLATVYGDVHDIGKNLVKTILANNGYTVIDLGKQVPAETIITKAVEANASAIGLSALLVNTSKQMPLIVNELQRRGLKFPVLVGGAAINRRFGWRILYTEDGSPYEPGVFYCKDAFEGLATMDDLVNPQRRLHLLARLAEDAARETSRRPNEKAAAAPLRRSAVVPAPIPVPANLIWGPRVVRSMPLEMVFQHLFKNELFRLSWGAKNTHGEEWERLHAEFESRLERMQREARRDGWLQPQAVYGYWPCQSDGDDLVLFDPDSLESGSPTEIMRFSFPRQPQGDFLCLADYFAPLGSGAMDIVPLQVVTVGQQATERFDRLQADGNYSEAYYSHGLAVQTAEATAEYLHHHVRRELGLAEDRGKRYSWGYPAIPELSDHAKVFELLPARQDLGMSLTEAYQLVPEQSTAAIVVHHPQAKYYTLGESRADQLTTNPAAQPRDFAADG